MIQGADGDFYGVCANGGTKNAGTFFKITSTGVFTKLRDFSRSTDGYGPGGLSFGNDGNFYGTCVDGGSNNDGTIFKVTPSGILTKLRDLDKTIDGNNPRGHLLLVSEEITFSNLTNISSSENEESFNFFAYPNPASGSFIIKLPSNINPIGNCLIFNSLGQYVTTLSSGKATLPKGFYLVRYNGQSKKLIIE